MTGDEASHQPGLLGPSLPSGVEVGRSDVKKGARWEGVSMDELGFTSWAEHVGGLTFVQCARPRVLAGEALTGSGS